MQEYFSFDMNLIQTQVDSLTDAQLNKIERDRDHKTSKAIEQFNILSNLSKLHFEKGSNQGGPSQEDLIPYFEQQTKEYEIIATEANI